MRHTRWLMAVVIGMALAGLATHGREACGAEEPTATPTPQLTPFALDPDFYPLLSWCELHRPGKHAKIRAKHGIDTLVDCGFNVVGFVAPEDLPRCEELGVKAILFRPVGKKPWHKMSDEEIDREVQEMVAQGGSSPALLGYFIQDEPGTQYFAALAKAVAAVKRHAPGKLAYINLYPSYATIGAPDKSQLGAASYPEYLERFVQEVRPQLLSYDNYLVITSDDQQQAERTGGYYQDLVEVRRIAHKYQLPFWNIVCCNQLRKYTAIPTPANLALQAYTTLAAGADGLTWFRYYSDGYGYAPIDLEGDRTETWQYLQVVNRQVAVLGPLVNRLTSTGVYFTAPAPANDLPLLPGRVVANVQSISSPRGFSKLQPPVMVGEFRDAQGLDYVMLVNLSLEHSANLKLETTKPYGRKEIASAVDGRWTPLQEENGQWISPGNGLLVRFQPVP